MMALKKPAAPPSLSSSEAPTPVVTPATTPRSSPAPRKPTAFDARIFQLEEAKRQIGTTYSAIVAMLDSDRNTAEEKIPLVRSALENLKRPAAMLEAFISATGMTTGGARRSKTQRR